MAVRIFYLVSTHIMYLIVVIYKFSPLGYIFFFLKFTWVPTGNNLSNIPKLLKKLTEV